MSTICSDTSNNSFIQYLLLQNWDLMNFPCMSSIFVTIIDLKWCIDHTALFDLSTQTSRPTWGGPRTLRPPHVICRQFPILRTEGPPNDASEWHFRPIMKNTTNDAVESVLKMNFSTWNLYSKWTLELGICAQNELWNLDRPRWIFFRQHSFPTDGIALPFQRPRCLSHLGTNHRRLRGI